MAKANTRLVGHGLLREGAAFGDSGAEHKADVRQRQAGSGDGE